MGHVRWKHNSAVRLVIFYFPAHLELVVTALGKQLSGSTIIALCTPNIKEK